MTASWPDLLRRPIRDETERHAIAVAVAGLSQPPRRQFVLGRVVALLSQYYAADLPQSVVATMASDWEAALMEYPEWAIVKAVRWWKSQDNPDRKRKPLEGDIAARANAEMSLVRVAERALRKFNEGTTPFTATSEKIDPPIKRERAAEIMREVGFKAKTFGGRNE